MEREQCEQWQAMNGHGTGGQTEAVTGEKCAAMSAIKDDVRGRDLVSLAFEIMREAKLAQCGALTGFTTDANSKKDFARKVDFTSEQVGRMLPPGAVSDARLRRHMAGMAEWVDKCEWRA